LRAQLGEEAFPKRADEYLNDWAAYERRWLRKYYPDSSDEPNFDLTPATGQAIAWLAGLEQRQFIDEARSETVAWTDASGIRRQATLPLVVFGR